MTKRKPKSAEGGRGEPRCRLRGWGLAWLLGGLVLGFGLPSLAWPVQAATAQPAKAKAKGATAAAGKAAAKQRSRTAPATGRPSSPQPAARNRATGKTSRSTPRTETKGAARVAAVLGTADILESDLSGLHGSASFYGQGFHGRRTATGEIFNIDGFTAASNRFPLGSKVAVYRPDNGRCVVVRVNDRMAAHHKRRIIDLSRGAAESLDMLRAGLALVRVAPLTAQYRDHSPEDDDPAAACRHALGLEPECADCALPILPRTVDR